MKDLAEEIEKRPWIFLGTTAFPLYITIYPPLYTDGFMEQYGQEAEIIYASGDSNRAYWYMRGDQLDALAEKELPMLLEEKWSWLERCLTELARFQDFNREFLAMSLPGMDDSEVLKTMSAYREQFSRPFTTNNLLEAFSYYFQHSLKNLLVQEGLTADGADELIEKYGQSARPNYVKECAEQYRRAASEEDREHVRHKFYFVFNDYKGPHETTHEELRKLTESTPYEYALQHTTEGISKRAQDLLSAFQVVATVQDLRKAELLEMVSAAHRFGSECARRNSVSLDDIQYATWAEIENSTWRLEDLRARREPFVMYWSLEGAQIHQGIEATHLIACTQRFIIKVDSEATEVKGICASKGTVRGRAVIAFEPNEFERVRDGDILFTIMTRPEFLPVMSRAAAFVCDEGGLTSHAAIVAREMRKPCIVATRTGTRTVRDGDLVEVDASAGTVRILERA